MRTGGSCRRELGPTAAKYKFQRFSSFFFAPFARAQLVFILAIKVLSNTSPARTRRERQTWPSYEFLFYFEPRDLLCVRCAHGRFYVERT